MDAEHSIIASSSQTSIPLPSTLFKIGEESRGASSINNHSTFNYVKLVKDILSEPLFNKLKSTFLGPIIKAGLRRGGGKQMGDGLGFSASLVHYLLVRQITTTKKDELWFYFNNQPMRFTLREFHLVTGLPCYAEDKIQVEENINWPMVTEKHTPEDLLAQLRALGNDDEESKLRLAMLLLLESIFLFKYALNKPSMYFTAEMLERGKNKMHTYPWGKLAFDLLVDSVHKLTGKLHTGSSKKDLKGFPMALQLWMLASVPALETAFAQSESDTSGFVCERYVVTRQPSYYEIESVAESTSPSVISFLGSDEEDYEDDDPFKMMMKMVKGGYPWTELDWRRGFILVEKAQQFIEVEKAQEDGGYASPRLETSVSLGLEASPRLETSVSLGLEASPRLSNSLHEPDTGDKDEFGKEDEDEQDEDEDEDVLVEDEDEDEQDEDEDEQDEDEDEDVLVDQLKELNFQEQPEQEKVGVYKTRAGRVVKRRVIYSP